MVTRPTHPDDGGSSDTPPVRVRALARSLRKAIGDRAPRAAAVLATGRTSLTQGLVRPFHVDPADLGAPGLFPESAGFTVGEVGDADVLLCGPLWSVGEGTSAFEATLPLRILREAGVEHVVLTAAGASLAPDLAPGTVVAVADHVDLSGVAALATPGGPWPEFGARYPDLTNAYETPPPAIPPDEPLRRVVAASVAGPQLPTPAEYRAFREVWRADVAVAGLATSAVVARQSGLSVTALVAVVEHVEVTAPKPVALEEMVLAADRAAPTLARSVLATVAAHG